MVTIRQDGDYVTQINFFRVAPERQQQLVDRLAEFHALFMAKQPGFVAIAMHQSVDGTMVVNYVQWASQEQLDAVHRDPAFLRRFDSFKHLFIEATPKIYEVVDINQTPSAMPDQHEAP